MRQFVLIPALVLCLAAGFASAQDAKQKIKTARQLAKEGSGAIAQLSEMLSDSSTEVRAEAVKAIATIGTQQSLDPLVRATRDNDSTVQIRAIEGLVNFYLPGYIGGRFERLGSAIKSRWTDTNDQVIPAYVQVRPDVVQAVGTVARGGTSMESRAAAARAAGVLRARAAVPDLIQALRSKDDAVMYESVIALQKIGDTSAAPSVSVYIRDFDERVAVAAMETLGLMRYSQAVPELQKVYGAPRTDKVRRAALSALAMLPEAGSRPLFRTALMDKDDAIRTAGAEGYARLGDAKDVPALEKLFNEEKKIGPRLAAAFALVKLGKTELGEFTPLRYLLNTLNSKAQHGVAEGYLRELAREPMVREQIYASLSGASRDEKVGIARVLAASGDARSAQYLDTLSKDPDQEVAQEGIAAARTLRARIK